MTTAIKERPILMNAAMVRAVLDGRKTQTRRIIKPQPPAYINDLHGGELSERAPYELYDNETGVVCGHGFADDNDRFYTCPFGKVGERIWVRETFGEFWGGYKYRATYDHPDLAEGNWKPSIHMPRKASRITLEITDVRVERLVEISEADAYAEGVTIPPHHAFASGGNPELRNEARVAFTALWESINGPDSWAANPWLWVISFRRIDA